jgi:hypothetical protein
MAKRTRRGWINLSYNSETNIGMSDPFDSWQPPPVPARAHYFVSYGVPAALLGLGVTAVVADFGYFWWGEGIASLGVLGFAFGWYYEHRAKAILATVGALVIGIIGLGVVWYFAALESPLGVSLAASDDNYPPGSSIHGLVWRSDYSAMNVLLSNDTNQKYSDFDAFVYSNLGFWGSGIDSGINHCIATQSFPSYLHVFGGSLSGVTRSGKKIAVPLFANTNQAYSTLERIRCDSIAPNSTVTVALAIPRSPQAEMATWGALVARYHGGFRDRTVPPIMRCFVRNCVLPKALPNPWPR